MNEKKKKKPSADKSTDRPLFNGNGVYDTTVTEQEKATEATKWIVNELKSKAKK